MTAIIPWLLRVLTRLPLLIRIWWRSPEGADGALVEAALKAPGAQFEHVARSSVGGAATARWRQALLFGGYARDAFAIECDDEPTRSFLEEELFGWRRRHHEGRDLPTVITEFADRALLGLPCLIEVRFEERDGKTHFAGLTFLQPKYVRREGGKYVITPPNEASGERRTVERSRMLDTEVDAPVGLGALERAQLIDAYFDERILDRANAATMEAQLQSRRGVRWDAARLRRIDTRRTYLFNARTTHLLAASMIERQFYYYDKPPFTDFFLRWQLHDCLRRIETLREAVLKLVDERVLRVLTETNGLPAAHLTVVTAPSGEQAREAYDAAQRTSEQPFAYYRRATRVSPPPS